MRRIIRKYLREAVGVPSGIYEASTELYELLLQSINDIEGPLPFKSDENRVTYDFTYNTDFNIADLNIKKIDLELTLIETDQFNRPTILGMGFASRSKTQGAKIIPIFEDNSIMLKVSFAIPPNVDIQELKTSFVEERIEIISSISHELKHSYDHFKKPTMSLYDLSRYAGIQQIDVEVFPMRRFLYLLYFSHSAENLVRPSELYTNMRLNKISEVDFYRFITSTNVWINLNELSNWEYETFRKDLKNNIPKIKRFIEKVIHEDSDIDDESLIDLYLKSIYIGLVNGQLETAYNMLVKSFQESIVGLSGDKEKLFRNIIKTASRFEDNPINFYIFEGNSFHKISDILKRKISKIYSLIEK